MDRVQVTLNSQANQQFGECLDRGRVVYKDGPSPTAADLKRFDLQLVLRSSTKGGLVDISIYIHIISNNSPPIQFFSELNQNKPNSVKGFCRLTFVSLNFKT